MIKKQASITIDVPVGCGNLYTIITHVNWKPVSIMCHLGRSGTCTKVFMDSMTLLATVAIANGTPIDSIIDSINNHHCSRPKKVGNATTWSCADGLAKALKQFKVEAEKALKTS